MSRPRRRPRSKTPEKNRRITLPDSDEEDKYKKKSRKARKEYREQIEENDNKSRQVEFMAKDIIKDIFNQHKDLWPRHDTFLGVFDNFVASSKTKEEGEEMEVISEHNLLKWAAEARKKRKKTLDAARRAERGRISNQYHAKKEEERQKLCKDFGICSAAAFAGMGVAAAVGAPVIATAAAGAATAAAAAKYRGAFFGGRTRRKKTRKRKKKTKRKSRRKKRKKRKTRRLRRKSRKK